MEGMYGTVCYTRSVFAGTFTIANTCRSITPYRCGQNDLSFDKRSPQPTKWMEERNPSWPLLLCRSISPIHWSCDFHNVFLFDFIRRAMQPGAPSFLATIWGICMTEACY
jgi:hypothetical protein